MKISDIYKYLNFIKFDKLNLEEGRIYVQKYYKNQNLPEILKVELNNFDDKHISFQPHEKITKIEIYIFFEYADHVDNPSYTIEYTTPYIRQAKIRVKLKSSKGNNKYFFFRIDTHFEESEFPHPLYHIQINDKDFNHTQNYGDISFINTPRFFLYPMDLFLIVDFILHNFTPKSREKLSKDKYSKIIKDIQKRLWTPFFEKIFSYLNDGNCEEEAKKFLPSLI